MDVKTFIHLPLFSCSYDDYSRKTGHQKVADPKPKQRGKSKGKKTINCYASDLSLLTSPSELINVIKAVAVDDRSHAIVFQKTAKLQTEYIVCILRFYL